MMAIKMIQVNAITQRVGHEKKCRLTAVGWGVLVDTLANQFVSHAPTMQAYRRNNYVGQYRHRPQLAFFELISYKVTANKMPAKTLPDVRNKLRVCDTLH